MKPFFTEQFRYNQWANQRMLTFIGEHQLQNNRIHPIFAHLTLGQMTWVERLRQRNMPVNITDWANWSWLDIESNCIKSGRELISIVDSHPDDQFDEKLTYMNTSGTEHQRAVKQVLINLLHYTTYHRGQLAAIIHQNENLATPSIEFVDFLGG
jgi:uncharacterized damage-inducible protein DinB